MNKPIDPIVGDAWADEDTLEIKIWDGKEWIVLPEPPATPPACPTIDMTGDNDTGMYAPKENELTLIPVGVKDPYPNTLSIINNFETQVTIDLASGDVEFSENYNPTEAAKIFWESISNYKYSEQGSFGVLQELRNILGVKETESILSVASDLIGKTHDEDCNWHTWNHNYSWSDSDCTCVKDDCAKDEPWFVPAGVELRNELLSESDVFECKLPHGDEENCNGSKVETLPGGELPGRDDIEYFRDKLARAMELRQVPLIDKLEKQIKVMEVLDEGDISEDELWYMPAGLSKKLARRRKVQAFDDAMKVIE